MSIHNYGYSLEAYIEESNENRGGFGRTYSIRNDYFRMIVQNIGHDRGDHGPAIYTHEAGHEGVCASAHAYLDACPISKASRSRFQVTSWPHRHCDPTYPFLVSEGVGMGLTSSCCCIQAKPGCKWGPNRQSRRKHRQIVLMALPEKPNPPCASSYQRHQESN